MKKSVFIFIFGVFLIGMVSTQNCTDSNVLCVKKDGNGDFTTIQSCVNAILPGQTCLVFPGVYEENIRISIGGSSINNKVIFKSAIPNTVVVDGGTTYAFRVTANNVIIESFNITRSQHGGWVSDSCIDVTGAANVDIFDNYLYDCKIIAIGIHQSNGTQIINNKIYKSGQGIYIEGFNILVENNEVERLYSWSNDGQTHHIDNDYIRFFGEGHIIKGNYLHGTIYNEITHTIRRWYYGEPLTCQTNSDCEYSSHWCDSIERVCKYHSHVGGFQTYDNDGKSIKNITIENNIVSSFHSGIQATAAIYDLSTDILVRNNIFIGGDVGGSLSLSIEQIKNVTAVNNLFYQMQYHGVVFSRGATGYVYNNIFYNAGSNYWSSDEGVILGSGNNILYPTRYPNYYVETDLLNINPLLINPEEFDFRLQESSPAIDAGFNLQGLVDYDIIGTQRPQGAGWDIGPYEYISEDPQDLDPEPLSQQLTGIITLQDMLNSYQDYRQDRITIETFLEILRTWVIFR